MSFLRNYKNQLSKSIEINMTRMRTQPKLFHYCYILASNNLKTLKKALINSKKEQHNLKILDIGCGNKPFLNLFDKNDNYIGIDFSQDSCADIIQDLNKDFPFDNNYFDIIIISETLEHLPDPLKVLNETSRVLKRNGIIFISTPFCLNIHGRPYDYYRYTEYFYTQWITSKLPIKCKSINVSNSIITTPLGLLPYIVLVIPFIPNFLKSIFNIFKNLNIIALEKLFLPIRNKSFIKNFMNSLPLGYAVIFEKK